MPGPLDLSRLDKLKASKSAAAPQDGWDRWDSAALATRVGGGYLSSMGFGPGAAIGGASEGVAQLLEYLGGTNKDLSMGNRLGRIGSEAALSAIPGAGTFKAGRAGTSAIRGAAMAGTGEAARQTFSEDKEYDFGRIAGTTAAGGALGGVLAKILPAKMGGRNVGPQDDLNVPPVVPPRNLATEGQEIFDRLKRTKHSPKHARDTEKLDTAIHDANSKDIRTINDSADKLDTALHLGGANDLKAANKLGQKAEIDKLERLFKGGMNAADTRFAATRVADETNLDKQFGSAMEGADRRFANDTALAEKADIDKLERLFKGGMNAADTRFASTVAREEGNLDKQFGKAMEGADKRFAADQATQGAADAAKKLEEDRIAKGYTDVSESFTEKAAGEVDGVVSTHTKRFSQPDPEDTSTVIEYDDVVEGVGEAAAKPRRVATQGMDKDTADYLQSTIGKNFPEGSPGWSLDVFIQNGDTFAEAQRKVQRGSKAGSNLVSPKPPVDLPPAPPPPRRGPDPEADAELGPQQTFTPPYNPKYHTESPTPIVKDEEPSVLSEFFRKEKEAAEAATKAAEREQFENTTHPSFFDDGFDGLDDALPSVAPRGPKGGPPSDSGIPQLLQLLTNPAERAAAKGSIYGNVKKAVQEGDLPKNTERPYGAEAFKASKVAGMGKPTAAELTEMRKNDLGMNPDGRTPPAEASYAEPVEATAAEIAAGAKAGRPIGKSADEAQIEELKRALGFLEEKGGPKGAAASADQPNVTGTISDAAWQSLGLDDALRHEGVTRTRSNKGWTVTGPKDAVAGLADELQSRATEGAEGFGHTAAQKKVFQKAYQALTDAMKPKGSGGTTLGAGLGGGQDIIRTMMEKDPEFALRALLGIGGAAGGAALDDENRVRGALVGGAAGVAAPSLKNIKNLDKDSIMSGVQKVTKTIPQIRRFNYLADPVSYTEDTGISSGLGANAFAGPYGSSLMRGIELTLAQDPKGMEILKQLNPIAFGKGMKDNWKEAARLINEGDLGRAEGSGLEQTLPNWLHNIMKFPAVAMTSGDVTSRKILEKAGLDEKAAREATHTSEPIFPLIRRLANLTKGSPLGQTIAPFTRTPANLAEQSALRLPGIGSYLQHVGERFGRDADPWQQQVAQQSMTAGLGYGGYKVGESYPESKFARQFATNLGGNYSVPVSLGLAIGQAKARGRNPAKALASQGIVDKMIGPLPTTDALVEDGSAIARLLGIEGFEDARIPRSLMPPPIAAALGVNQKQDKLSTLRSQLKSLRGL